VVAPRGLVIAWAFFVAAALVLAVGVGAQAADMATPFAIPHAYRLLVGTELFLVLVVYRLWVALGEGGPGFWWVVALLALAGPAVVATAWMSEAGAARVAMSQGYLVAGAFFVSAMPRRAGGLYWALVVGCGAGAPTVAFVAHDNLGVGLGWLAAFSPFWALDKLAAGPAPWWTWAFTGAFFVLAGLVLRLTRAVAERSR